MPAGASYRTFIYYGQCVRDKAFNLYDYGMSANVQLYGQPIAPAVPVEEIKIPVALFYGDIDPDVTDVDV